MKYMYFCQLDSLKKSQMDDLVSLLIHVHSSQKLMPEWENTLNACSDSLDVIDLPQDTLPSISMEELVSVLVRFLEYARREREMQGGISRKIPYLMTRYLFIVPYVGGTIFDVTLIRAILGFCWHDLGR